MAHPKRHEDYVSQISAIGIEVNEQYKGATKGINHTCPKCGKKDWRVKPTRILSGRFTMCLDCSNKKRLMLNYKERAKALGVVVIGDYVNTRTKIAHKCTKCGREDWMVKPNQILYHGVRMCKECSNTLEESAMAKVVKQVLQQEFGAVFEYDAGYKGVLGGKSLYDIFVPKLNLLIECQSSYHDINDGEENDRLKEKYAINKGFKFMALDSRKYSTIQALQLFFPEMTNIPDYVKLDKPTRLTFSLEEAQSLLDEGKTTKEVANIIRVGPKTIDYNIGKGRLIKKTKYSQKLKKHTEIVLQIDRYGKIVGEYDFSKIHRVDNEKNYCIKLRIARACNSESHYYKSYYWFYKDDYNNSKPKTGIDSKDIFPLKEVQEMLNKGKTYNEIAELIEVTKAMIQYYVRSGKLNKNMPVIQLDRNKNIVGKYELSTILKKDNYRKYLIKLGIIEACNSNSHIYQDFYWYFEVDYHNMIAKMAE